MGDIGQVNQSKPYFIANEGNQLLEQEAYLRNDWLADRNDSVDAAFNVGKANMFKHTGFVSPRQSLTGFSTFDYFYNPASYIYNLSLKK